MLDVFKLISPESTAKLADSDRLMMADTPNRKFMGYRATTEPLPKDVARFGKPVYRVKALRAPC